VPDGAWFTITLAAVLAAVFILWRFGKEQQWAVEAEDRFPTTHFVLRGSDGVLALTQKYGGSSLSQITGAGIFFDKAGETTPIIFSQFVRKLKTTPAVMVFFHLRPLEKPTVALEDRYSVSKLAIPNCYRLVVRHGYMDEVITPDLGALIHSKIREHIIHCALHEESAEATVSDFTVDPVAVAEISGASTAALDKKLDTPPSTTTARLEAIDHAFQQEILYIIGKEQMRIKPGTSVFRSIILHVFLFLREITRGKIASLKVRRDRVIEVGFIKDI
jgi:KUP system potassium uptake protein